MTLEQLRSAHATAGARYAAALDEFLAAFVDLAAIDAALSNGNVDKHRSDPVRTFVRIIERHEVAHPVFAPHDAPHLVHDAVIAARDAHINQVSRG